MPRPREYDRQTVIEKASRVFYAKGFDGASMSELVGATGLNTASMYKEFGSKEGLFEASLDDYRNAHISALIARMESQPGLAALQEYLEKLQDYAGSPEFNGCLLLNNLAEKNLASDGTVERVDSLCARLEELFTLCLSQAQRDGQVPAEKDPRALANYILCFVHGVTLYARMQNRQGNLPSIFEQLMVAISR